MCITPCFPTSLPRKNRVPQNTIRGSEKNHGISKYTFLKYGKKFQISLEISQKYLSGIWQLLSDLHALPTVFFLCPENVFVGILSSTYGKLSTGSAVDGKLGNTDLQGSVFSV
jgi:hypothetical protein